MYVGEVGLVYELVYYDLDVYNHPVMVYSPLDVLVKTNSSFALYPLEFSPRFTCTTYLTILGQSLMYFPLLFQWQQVLSLVALD